MEKDELARALFDALCENEDVYTFNHEPEKLVLGVDTSFFDCGQIATAILKKLGDGSNPQSGS
jgi:hypothetical protein